MLSPVHPTYASVENIFSSPFLPDASRRIELSNLLRNNTIPPDPSYFRAVVMSAHWEFVRYRIDIRTLKNALESLLSEREIFERHVAQCSSVLAPVRSLPSEILVEIFTYSLTTNESFERWVEPPRSSTPEHLIRLAKSALLILSRVCCSWHSIIMGTPSLWTSVEVNFDEWFRPSIARRSAALFRAALARAKSSALRVKTRMGKPYGSEMELLAQYSHLWHTVDLQTHMVAFNSMSIARGNLPNLEVLGLSGTSLDQLQIFEVAPRLREVTLRGSVAIDPPPLPWRQLRVLNCGKTDSRTIQQLCAFVGLIPRCPNVTEINFWIDLSGVYHPFSFELLCLTLKLNHLSITIWDDRHPNSGNGDVVREMLESFTVRGIASLAFEVNTLNPLFWPHHNFLAFAGRSSCSETLTSISLRGIIITDVELLYCLGTLPHLETLAIADLGESADYPEHILITDNLLSALIVNSESSPLIPHLHVTHLACRFSFTDQSLLDFVTSRIQIGRTITEPFRLELRYQDDVVPSIDAILDQFAELQRQRNLWYSLKQEHIPLDVL